MRLPIGRRTTLPLSPEVAGTTGLRGDRSPIRSLPRRSQEGATFPRASHAGKSSSPSGKWRPMPSGLKCVAPTTTWMQRVTDRSGSCGHSRRRKKVCASIRTATTRAFRQLLICLHPKRLPFAARRITGKSSIAITLATPTWNLQAEH